MLMQTIGDICFKKHDLLWKQFKQKWPLQGCTTVVSRAKPPRSPDVPTGHIRYVASIRHPS